MVQRQGETKEMLSSRVKDKTAPSQRLLTGEMCCYDFSSPQGWQVTTPSYNNFGLKLGRRTDLLNIITIVHCTMYKADRLPPNHNFKSKQKINLMIFFAKQFISTRLAPTEEAGEKGINVFFSRIKDKGCAKI